MLRTMKLVNDSGTYYLDENGQRVALTPRDLNLFRQMNPMGRKLTLRKRALEKGRENPQDPEIPVMMGLSRLPASEWGFIVPD
ncbi:MAG: hypothetical protein JF616_17680 [Fibrobacteres bacterium]|jgi:hypothetical protein|nr:hypothetical protein [Fibrobacterota bacterium]